MQRDYDIVLFGATGFVGELTAAYLAANAPGQARLAIAGRDRARLEILCERLGRPGLGLLVADASNTRDMEALAGSTRVVASTVGPYILLGEPLVAACARAGTDYADLTGEAAFVDLVYLRHHETARRSGARLVHSCGFDSLPYDLGALFAVDRLPGDVPVALRGFGLASGSISGGTFHSAVHAMADVRMAASLARQRRIRELHSGEGEPVTGRRVRGVRGHPHREPLAGGWVLPAPTIDPQHVLRSARYDSDYGPDFSYSHYLVTGGAVATLLLGAGVATIAAGAQLRSTRNLLLRLRKAGTGPDAERRARSFFRVRMLAKYGPIGERRLQITEVRGGDPGYGETAKMLAESVMALAFDAAVPLRGGGQWTPALALGRPLIARLQAAGIAFEVLEPPPAGKT